MLDVVVVDGRAAGIVVRDLLTGEIQPPLRPRRGARHRRLRATSSTCRPTPWRATSPRRGGPTAGARCSPTPATRRSTRPASRQSDEFQSKLTLMSESLRNDGRIWVPVKAATTGRPTRSPRRSATTTSSASTRRSATSSPATSPRATPRPWSTRARASGPLHNGVYLDFARRHRAPRPRRHRGALREPLRDVRAHHRREPLRGADAHLPGPPLHDGRALGGLRAETTLPGLYVDRRGQLQPTRAPTASAPRR